MNASGAYATMELLLDELRAIRNEACKRGHGDIEAIVSHAILDVGCIVERVDRACDRSNQRFMRQGGEET